MGWEVEYVDEFEQWWNSLNDDEQDSVTRYVDLLARYGTTLDYPYSSKVRRSRHNMRELRVQHRGSPYRVLYAFDPRRTAILLLGGDKTGDDAWYERNVPIADHRYEKYLEELKSEELI